MPLKLLFRGKARKYDVSSKNAYVVCVRLLDNSLMECTLSSDSIGQECLENISQRIELGQTTYFGLGYVNKKLQFRWLDLDRPIKKQLDKYASSPLIYFGVMFYIPDIHKISNAITRYQFYLQLKSDVIEGKLPCTPEQSVLLAAYSVQAEFGSYNPAQHHFDFYKSYVLLPKTLSVDESALLELNQEMCNQHHNLQGVSKQNAELQYIMEAQQLEDCGCEYYSAKDESGKELLLGVSFVGVFMKSIGQTPTVYFKWADISKVVHNKKTLGIETALSPKTVHFTLDEVETAKYVFKMCSLQHKFYHIVKGNDIINEPPEDPPDGTVASVGPPFEPSKEALSTDVRLDLDIQHKQFTKFQSTDQDTSNSSSHINDTSAMSENTYDTTPYMSISDSPDNSVYLTQQQSHELKEHLDNQTAIQLMTEAYTHAASNEADAAEKADVFTDSNDQSPQYEQHPLLQTIPTNSITTTSNHTSNGYLPQTVVHVPEYRSVPDYTTVMQQRLLLQQQQQQQQIHPQNLETVQANLLHSSGNLNHTQAYSNTKLDGVGISYNQPTEMNANPAGYPQQYLTHTQPPTVITGGQTQLTYTRPPVVNGGTGLQYSQSFLESQLSSYNSPHNHAQQQFGRMRTPGQYGKPRTPGQYGKPVDRTNSLIIHPTYYVTEAQFPTPNNQFSTSEIMLRDYVSNLHRPPPPYRMGSSSTPDLASQNAILNLSSSPELVSPKFLSTSNHNLMTQSQFDQSVENLALDAKRLQLTQQMAAKSKQQLAEEQSSSEQLSYNDGVNYNPHLLVQSQDSLNHSQQVLVQSQDSLHQNLNHNQQVLVQSQDSLHQKQHFINENVQQAQSQSQPRQVPPSFNLNQNQGYAPPEGISEETEVFITGPPNLQNSHSPPHYHPMLAAQYSQAPNQMFYTGNAIDLINQIQTSSNKKEHIYQNLPPQNTELGYGEENPYENLPSALQNLQQSSVPAVVNDTLVSESTLANPENSEHIHNKTNSMDLSVQESSTTVSNQLETGIIPAEPVDTTFVNNEKSENLPSQSFSNEVNFVKNTETTPMNEEHGYSLDVLVPICRAESVLSSRKPSIIHKEKDVVEQEQLDTTVTDYEDSDSAPSGLKKAAANGLSLSRADIIEMNDNELRAPKDERRGALENKLEEGQVFAEFENIPKMKPKCDTNAASLPENKEKNRFKDVFPYDFNRVILKATKNNKSGYINASHIKMTVGKCEWWYVAAQGPKPDTVVDFWQMVWEQEIQVIAMLTDLIEFGKQKCHRYWPEDQGSKSSTKYGDFTITLKFTNDSGSYITRGLNLRNNKLKKERLVWHLQYTDWPDHACPEDAYGFLAYLDEIESVRRHATMEKREEYKSPVLVHCSAGVGRSGVVILAEIMKACLEHNQDTDIATVLCQLREQRMYLVQTVSQYSFVYQTLVTYLKSSRLI